MVFNSTHLFFAVLSDELNMFKLQAFLHFISVVIMQLHHFSICLPTFKPYHIPFKRKD